MSTGQTSYVRAAVLVAMLFCLAFEGLIIALSGFPFKGRSIDVYVVGIVWLGSCVATFYYPKKPIFALVAGWLMLVVTSISMTRNQIISHSVLGFLFQHFIELLYIAASHIGYLLAIRKRARPAQ